MSDFIEQAEKALEPVPEGGAFFLQPTREKARNANIEQLLRQAIMEVRERDGRLHFIRRVSEESAKIMRDPVRTGEWAGAEKTARQFDRLALRAALGSDPAPSPWRVVDDRAPKGVPHMRGVWIHHAKTGDRLYWQADTGTVSGDDFIGSNGDDFGIPASAYTHWMPLTDGPGDAS